MSPAAAVAAAATTLADLPQPPGLPLLGHALQLRPDRLHLQLEAWHRALGPLYVFRIGTTPVLACSHTDWLQQAARERPLQWRRWRNIEPIFDELGANGLFSVEGPAWYRQRRLVMQALNATHFKAFFPTLQRITERLRARLHRAAVYGEVVEMRELLTRYTVDVTTALAFGEDPDTLSAGDDVIQRHLSQVFPTLMSRVTAPLPLWRWWKTPADRRFERSLQAIHRHVRRLIESARRELAEHPGRPPANLLQTLLAARDDDGGGLSDDEVFANVFTVLLGGEDTTANAIAWSLPFVAADPAWQQQLHDEALAAFGDARVCPNHDALRRLDACEATVTEAGRLKPTVSALFLEPCADTRLGGLELPAGTRVAFTLRPDANHERHFAEPARFEPSRWLRRRSGGCPVGAHEPRAHLPFGTGARVCPGRHLASVEMRLVLSMLARSFRIELACDPEEIDEITAFATVPSRMPVRLHERR